MSAKRDVLAAMGGIPDLSELVPPSFRERFGLAEPSQYGMVCADVRAGISRLEAAGAEPFLFARTGPPNWTERGEPRPVRVDTALGYVDHQQIELLGHGTHTDVYSEKIPADGSLALHHVGIHQLGIERVRGELAAAGYERVVDIHMAIGPFYSVDVSYFDTRDELGVHLEILQFVRFGRHAPLAERTITNLGRLQQPFRRLRA